MTRLADADVGAPEAGLTLVEMIVALALGAMVIAFVAQGTGLIRGFGRLGAVFGSQDETLAIRDHLRRTIASASGGGSQSDGFAGVSDTAVFTAPGDRLLETGGPIRITLAAVREGDGVSLVETRARPGQDGNAQTRTKRLLTGAGRVSFSYGGASSDGAATTWASEWTDPEIGPRLMRIDLAFPSGDRRRWPSFIVALPTAHAPAAASQQGAAGGVAP